MEKTDLISIVIPVYKVEEYLDRCVQSVVDQTYKNLEIILIDDGSPDNCPKMCDEWAKKDKRIKVIHKPNGGVSSARNAGKEIATGKYLQFVDSDDYIDENYTESLLSGYIDGDVDLSCGGYKIIPLKGKIKLFSVKEYFGVNILEKGSLFLEFVLKWLLDVTVNKLYRMEFAKQIKFDENLPLSEDRKFTLDYFKLIKGRINFVDHCGYNYEYNDASAIHKKRENAFELLYQSFSNLIEFCKFKFDNYICDEYYHCIGGLVVAILSITPKNLIKQTIEKIKSLDCIKDYLKNFKPNTSKEVLRKWLIKNNMYKTLLFLSKLKKK